MTDADLPEGVALQHSLYGVKKTDVIQGAPVASGVELAPPGGVPYEEEPKRVRRRTVTDEPQ